MYTLDLQVWRPSPTVRSTGCYSLVGNNLFTSIALSDQVAFVTPQPLERINFQPGDVIGFSVAQDRERDMKKGVVILRDREERRDREYETEMVWYGHKDDQLADLDCPYPVGTAGVLSVSSDAAPVVSPLYSKLLLLSFIPRPHPAFQCCTLKSGPGYKANYYSI